MKKTILLVSLLTIGLSSFAAHVNDEVLKIFSNTYPGATSISWTEQAGNYLVYFKKKDISYRVLYDETGNIVYSIKYYGEDNLSPIILNKVKKGYPVFTIKSVVEKSTENTVEYHVIVEDEKKLISLKADPLGNYEIENTLTKL